jgi:hypothetical protein
MAKKFRKVYRKRIIRPGDYAVPDLDESGKVQYDDDGSIKTKKVTIPTERIDSWLANHKKMTAKGLEIPGPFRHDPLAVPVRPKADKKDMDAYNNGGFWRKLWKDKAGALWGEFEVERKDVADRIGTSIKDVSLVAKDAWADGDGDDYTDTLTHIALVTHPVAKDNSQGEGSFTEVTADPAIAMSIDGWENSDYVALSLSDLQLANDDGTNRKSKSNSVGDGMAEMNASALTVKDIISMLQDLDQPLRLPDDTSADNFLERLGTVLIAIQASKEGEGDEEGESIREPNKKSKEQPGPVAMSKELSLALDLLSKSGQTNPATGKAWTEADLKAKDNPTVTVKMSIEDQAAVNLARKALRKDYENKVSRLVNEGKITPQFAKKELAPKLENLQFAFDDAGNQIDTPFDTLLKAIDQLPKGASLTGPTSGSKAQKSVIFGQQAFSLGSVVDEPSLGELDEQDTDDDNDPDALDAQLDKQFALSGLGPAKVDGFRVRK